MGLLVKPFTQIYEDVKLEMRDASSEQAVVNKFKRRVNDIYVRDLPAKFEWDWLRASSYITLLPAYKVGTAEVTNGSASVIGIGTTWTAAMTGMKFTVPSTNEIYTFTRTSAVAGTISPVYQGATNASAGYAIFQDTYTLASDFGRPTTHPGFFYDYGSGRVELQWLDDTAWYKYYTTQTSQFPTFWRECPIRTSLGLYQVQVTPPVDTGRILSYEYTKALPEMVDFSTGTASTTAGSTSVTTSSDYSTSITAGQYFRANADGTWVKITAVSGASLTLESGYPSLNTTATYTVSDAPAMPYAFHEALFYGACLLTAKEQGDKSSMQFYTAAYIKAMDMNMATRNRKRYGQQYMRPGTSTRNRIS